jgi:small subunit ribosomal protein S20
MANHKSSLKRIRSNAAKRLRNRYQAKTTRNAIKKLRGTTSKVEATPMLSKVISMLDRLAKKNVIHRNKAARLKSRLAKKLATTKIETKPAKKKAAAKSKPAKKSSK